MSSQQVQGLILHGWRVNIQMYCELISRGVNVNLEDDIIPVQTAQPIENIRSGLQKSLLERYKDHPAILIWHVSNEYGGYCYCDQLCGRLPRLAPRTLYNTRNT